jgi:sulfate/thiosulfate transport system substrate-binding protein
MLLVFSFNWGRPRRLLLALPVLGALTLAGCGGASDAAGAPATATPAVRSAAPTTSSGGHLDLVAYSVVKAAFDKLIPAFQATEAGHGVDISTSYGASGDQSRKVESGLAADVVNFSLEPDVTRLVGDGLVDPNWKQDGHNGIVSDSVVTIVVRKGNPKGIHDWADLSKPGVEVVTPNPLSSGSAKWNLLAPYAEQSHGGADRQGGLEFVKALISHTKGQPKSGREATELFLAGTGDALLSYENEAILTESTDNTIEHVTPPTTFKIENPLAISTKSANPTLGKAFHDFLFTPAAQEIWASVGYRPVDPTILAAHAAQFPNPTKLWTIDDLGGWAAVNKDLFDPTSGPIAQFYNGA